MILIPLEHHEGPKSIDKTQGNLAFVGAIVLYVASCTLNIKHNNRNTGFQTRWLRR